MKNVVYILYRGNNQHNDPKYKAEVVAVYANRDIVEKIVERRNRKLEEKKEWIEQYFLEEMEVISD